MQTLFKNVDTISFCDDLYLPAVIDHRMFHVRGKECLWKHQADLSLVIQYSALYNESPRLGGLCQVMACTFVNQGKFKGKFM